MNSKSFLILVVTLVPALVAGCVSDESFQRQTVQLTNLQGEVRELKDQTKLRDMELERQLNQSRSGMPDLMQEIGRLRSETQRLTNLVEVTEQRGSGEALTLKQQLEYMLARLDRLESTLKLPPLPPPAAVTSPSPGTESGQPEGAAAESPPSETPAEPRIEVKPDASSPAAPTADQLKSEFDAAEALYKQQVWPAALDKFRAFIKTYPSAAQASAAQFYIGECLYQQKKYEEAIIEYNVVIEKYPDNDKRVSISLLKQAYSFLNIGDTVSAKVLLKKVIRDYPDSYSAKLARNKLPRIK
ncbi:MAG: tol-pal system protein YbgF [Proteobacteria bacterium]|nr:tol-pal system protein YbgF [Pseudomonadota bacterium]